MRPMNSLPDWERNRRRMKRATWAIAVGGIALFLVGIWAVNEALEWMLHVLMVNSVKGI